MLKFLLVFLASLTAFCLPAPAQVKTSTWNGFERLDFAVAGRPCSLVRPRAPAEGAPWIWRTEFFGHEPQGDLALLQAGWHVAFMQVSNMYGAPASIELMQQFHRHLVSEYELNRRAVLEGFSRGGLYAVNFAATHPDQTAALYLDAPVLDIRSWPGGKGKSKGDANCWKQALTIYGLTEETAAAFKGNPLDHAEALAKAGIPIIAVCGEADDVVPYAENTARMKAKYDAAGGHMQVVVKAGVNHHPHSLQDPAPIVEFVLKNWRRK